MLCLFCDSELSTTTRPEHILLDALGGRKTSRRLICSVCNNMFGGGIDAALAAQVRILRNMLQLHSGSGKAPPALKNVAAKVGTINIGSDGTPELTGPPFTISRSGQDATVQIRARSLEHLAALLPHIAAALELSVDHVRERILETGLTVTSLRPQNEAQQLSLGGRDANRSMAKACLELAATIVGNNAIRSAPFEEMRAHVSSAESALTCDRICLDERYLPETEKLTASFGPVFNLIYVRSDPNGRMLGHFTLYNLVGWKMVLAESGASPNVNVGLASNPLEPACWSDIIADDIQLPFDWLDAPGNIGGLISTRERMGKMIGLVREAKRKRAINDAVASAFKHHGIADDAVGEDPATIAAIVDEIGLRAASFVMNVPYVEVVTREKLGEVLQSKEYQKPSDMLREQADEGGWKMSGDEIYKSADNLTGYVEFMIKVDIKNK